MPRGLPGGGMGGFGIDRYIIDIIKNWIIGLCNSRDFIDLAIMVYEPLYHALKKMASVCEIFFGLFTFIVV